MKLKAKTAVTQPRVMSQIMLENTELSVDQEPYSFLNICDENSHIEICVMLDERYERISVRSATKSLHLVSGNSEGHTAWRTPEILYEMVATLPELFKFDQEIRYLNPMLDEMEIEVIHNQMKNLHHKLRGIVIKSLKEALSFDSKIELNRILNTYIRPSLFKSIKSKFLEAEKCYKDSSLSSQNGCGELQKNLSYRVNVWSLINALSLVLIVASITIGQTGDFSLDEWQFHFLYISAISLSLIGFLRIWLTRRRSLRQVGLIVSQYMDVLNICHFGESVPIEA